MLNGMRFGHLDPTTITKFKSLSRTVQYTDGIEPTDLCVPYSLSWHSEFMPVTRFPTRREVDAANTSRLNRIKEEPRQYVATDVPGYDPEGKPISFQQMERLLERLVAPKCIILKVSVLISRGACWGADRNHTLQVGAQVMLIKVKPQSTASETIELNRTLQNLVQGSLVNGSIGRVTDFLTTSEAKSSGVPIASVNEQNLKPNAPHIPESMMRSNAKWPLVKFQNGTIMLCVPVQFEVNDAEGNVEAARGQVCRRGIPVSARNRH